MLTITLENPDDLQAVEALTFEAFETMTLPGRTYTDEHYLAHLIRDSSAFIPELDFIGTVDGDLVANIMYTKSKVVRPNGEEILTITFGPVSVKPELQGQGYGSAIIRHSLEMAYKLGYGAVIILGHPDYYSRFGFKPASTYHLTLPDGSAFDAFMALELRQDYLGTSGGKWYEDKVFEIDETAFSEWHEAFKKSAT